MSSGASYKKKTPEEAMQQIKDQWQKGLDAG